MKNNSQNNTLTQKKHKRKFNFIDFLVLLVVLAIVGILIYVFSPWAHLEKLWTNNKIDLTYYVEIKDVDIDFVDNIKSGNQIINSTNKNALGSVLEISKREKAYVYDYVVDEEGNVTCVRSEQPDKYNITIKVLANAEYEEGIGYTVNGTRIAIGEPLDIRFPQFTCSGYCTQMSQ